MQNHQHNIVNILYAVRGMIESHLASVEDGRFGKENETLRDAEEVLRKAHSQANQALQIARRLGLILQPGEDPFDLDLKVSIKKAWRESLTHLEEEFSLEAVEILERIPENFPPIRCGDEALKEILYHLAKNAIEAMKGEGKLIIRVQLAFSVKEEPYALIMLADTGPGIPEAKLPHLFQPFFTTKTETDGNGLGLYLTKLLVEKNRGRITALSFEGFGTAFTLEFPIAVK